MMIILCCFSCSKNSESSIQGYIEGKYILVSTALSGKILSILITDGQEVKKGSILLTLDSHAEEFAYQEASHQVKSAHFPASLLDPFARGAQVHPRQKEEPFALEQTTDNRRLGAKIIKDQIDPL